MSKKKRGSNNIQKILSQYRNLLLFDLTGGTMGAAFEEGKGFKDGMTAAEKKGVYDSLLKEAAMDAKLNPEDEESAFDIIKKARES